MLARFKRGWFAKRRIALVLMLPAMLFAFRIAHSECEYKCAEVSFAAFYEGGSGLDTSDCREWQTDGADALLSANTKCIDPIHSENAVGGDGTAHPSIMRRERSWPDCQVECYDFPTTEDEEHEAGVYGTAGTWGGWTAACYCKTES